MREGPDANAHSITNKKGQSSFTNGHEWRKGLDIHSSILQDDEHNISDDDFK